jgi:hypothetical protein
MSNDSNKLGFRRTIRVNAWLVVGLVLVHSAQAQFSSAVDLSSRTARPGPDRWQSQIALSPFARFDHAWFAVDGRWTAFGAEGERLNGFGNASATFYSPSRAGLQFSLTGFASREMINETFAVSRFGTDARLSYKMKGTGVWLGREMSRDNKSTPISTIPRASAGAWRQWGDLVATVSVSAFGGREETHSSTTRKVPNPLKVNLPAGVPDTMPDSITVTDTDTSRQRRGWNDAEFAVHWGAGRLALRGIVGTRFLAARQPNELWGQLQGTYALGSDVALVAAGGVHPSSAAYGVSRARYLQLGVRIAPTALLRPRLPGGVRPSPAAFEVKKAERGRQTLRIRVPSARTVELSGDFTNWKPIALTRGDDDRWEVTLPISPGIHRVAIRVDGEGWTPPPGVNSVPDEFQGTVGVIIVK